jgi:hypothetical protein
MRTALALLVLALSFPTKTTEAQVPKPVQNVTQTTGQPKTENKPPDANKYKAYWDEAIKPDVLPIWIGSGAALLASIAGLVTLAFLYQQTKAGILAAGAAKQSADVATNAERAWIITSGVAFASDWPDLSDPGAPKKSKIVVEITNSGRSPAEIKAMHVVGVVCPANLVLPETPVYGATEEIFAITAMPGEIIPAGDKRTLVCKMRPDITLLTDEQIKEIKRRETVVYCYGRVKYKDISGSPRETHFGYYYHVRRDALDDIPESMYRTNSTAYNYTT